jgi:tetratricopeptide (TPR) repeat protein
VRARRFARRRHSGALNRATVRLARAPQRRFSGTYRLAAFSRRPVTPALRRVQPQLVRSLPTEALLSARSSSSRSQAGARFFRATTWRRLARRSGALEISTSRKNVVEESIPLFPQSLEKDPDNALTQYHLGMAYAKLGEHTKAITALKRSLSLDPHRSAAADARRALGELQVP